MKNILCNIRKYPIMALFFAFILIFSMADMFTPDKDISQLENRPLAQTPAFNWDAVINNEWTIAYGEYTKDQFLFRDSWITGQSILETVQGKVETNGVWIAKDGYQIAKNDIWSSLQAQQLPKNIKAVAELAARHPGKVDVMVAPSPANILSDLLPGRPPQIDENAYLDDIFLSLQQAGADIVDLRPAYLHAKENTQLFYRTDHHWTTTGGAWLAYTEYCTLQGIEPIAPPPDTLVEMDGFLGTNYAKTKRPGTRADILEYYNLPNPLTVYKPLADGGLQPEVHPLMETQKLETQDMYGAFIWGNNGYSELEGNGQGSILVIKDSYGNCFVPYLLENYAKIGIIDLRGWSNPIDETIESGGYDDILVLYSFNSFTSDQSIYRLQDALQKSE